MSYGQKSAVGIIFQNSYGTAGSVSSIHFIPFLSETLKLNKPPLYSENMRGIFDEGDTYEGPNTVEGDIETEAQPIALGAMIKTVMEEVTVVTSGSVYTRTFKPRTSDFGGDDGPTANNPVTIYTYLDTGSAMLYSDMNGSILELSLANGEFLKAKVSFVGGTFQQNASAAASFPSGKRWTWDTASVSFGGTAVDEVMNLTITLDDGALQAMHTLNNSKYPARVKRTGFRTIAISGTLKFDTQSEYQEFISQSERALVVHCQGTTQIQSGYYESITLKLPTMRYEEASPTAEGPGQIEMSITARGKYSVTSGTAYEITHVSTQTAY